jgi:hypothetical protein
MPGKTFYTATEVAEIFDVDVATVTRWLRPDAGGEIKLRATKHGRDWHIPRAEVERLAAGADQAHKEAIDAYGALAFLQRHALEEYRSAMAAVLATARDLIALDDEQVKHRPARQAPALDAHFRAVELLKQVAGLGTAIQRLTAETAKRRRTADVTNAATVALLDIPKSPKAAKKGPVGV